MRIVQVPVLSDNYSYLVIDENSAVSFAVDPAGPKQMLEAASKENVKISCILTTHHHGDHAGGNKELSKALGGVKVYGGDDRVEAVTNIVGEGDQIEVGFLKVKVLSTPCHTSGHVLYQVSDSNEETKPIALFTGDTLFIGGCGRFFEGTAEQMHHALCEVIASLPLDTEIYCGHEYTVKNLQFALTVDPHNQAVKDKLEWAKKQRESNLSTIPSTVAEELSYNPFMRVAQPEISETIGMSGASPIEVMAQVRKLKDKF